MNHKIARQIFEEIQARPYGLSIKAGEASNNCYFKGIELLQRLGEMGYTVRGRIGEIFWDPKIVPAEILELLPEDVSVEHFYVEAYINNEWRILDTSIQPKLAKYGFTIGAWEGGESCFPITKLYTQEEALAYREKWFDEEYQKAFFEKGGACWQSLNEWFQELDKS